LGITESEITRIVYIGMGEVSIWICELDDRDLFSSTLFFFKYQQLVYYDVSWKG